MIIGLVNVDGHNFPNLALMKISGWHKQNGDSVEWANAFFEYDRIYKSKVFTFTPDDMTAYQCNDIKMGGTGYDISKKLPPPLTKYAIQITAYTHHAITPSSSIREAASDIARSAWFTTRRVRYTL